MLSRLGIRPVGVALLALMAGAIAMGALAQSRGGANVNITPKRVTLDRNRRVGTIYVYNRGDAAGVFDISLVDRVMLPDGQIVTVDSATAKPDQKAYADQLKSARDVVVVSPRHVTLGPGQGQTIRLMIGQLPDSVSEFRSHLTISTLPDRAAGVTAEQAAPSASSQFQIAVNSVYGLSLPVIVRTGAADVRAAIENVHVDTVNLKPNPTSPALPTAVVSFDLVRQGVNSLFGDIDVRLSSQGAGDKPAGVALSVGVYPEIPRRHMQVVLNRRPGPGDHVLINFTDQDTQPGKLLATANF